MATVLRRERRNQKYLPEAELPAAVAVTADVAELRDCEPVFVVVPSHGFREVLRRFLDACPADGSVVLISATKGIETESLSRMSQVSAEEAAASGQAVEFAVLSGPVLIDNPSSNRRRENNWTTRVSSSLSSERRGVISRKRKRLITLPDIPA